MAARRAPAPASATRRRRRARPADRTAAERQRRKRRRERDGTRPAQIEVDFARAVAAIQRRDGLSELEAESLDWPAVEREVAAVWGEFIRAWGRR
jgi:hypothetical protein